MGDQMQSKKVTVLAMAKAKEGMEETVKQELLSLVKPTRSEPGCISYELHLANDDKSLFIFYENWKSMEDLDKHLGMPYLKAFLEKSEGLLAKPLEVTLLEMISEK
jgi:quinol monooxygenase YgiN